MKSYVLCCVSKSKINEHFLSEIRAFLSKSGARVTSSENYLEQGFRALDLNLEIPFAAEAVKFEMMNLSNKFQTDMALIPLDGRAQRKLIVFDMDSTLIQEEVIVEMARVYGVGDKVKEITERAMNGELNFDEALRERVSLLKGLTRSQMEGILSGLRLSSGAERLISTVHKHGYKTAIVSGGFRFFAEHFKNRLGMHYAFANELEFNADVLTGKVQGSVVNAEEKARLLQVLAKENNLTLDQVVAVGDGANDLPMLAKAGFGIAYHAKEKVRKEARHQMNHSDMTTILYFLGITGNHLDEVV